MDDGGQKRDFIPGLEGVVAAQTRLSSVDGQKGELLIAGFPVEAIAAQAGHEEIAYLLWHDRLPTRDELDAFSTALARHRTLPGPALALLQAAAARRVPAMDALRMATGTLNLDADDEVPLTLLAQAPLTVTAFWRLRQGQAPVAPAPELGQAANYLYTLTGERPPAARVRALETYWNTVADHGLNASTFTARTIISTDSDLVSAVVGAIGALKGPKHGGAPGPALETVFEIGSAERAEAVLRQKLDAGQRLMGFGHRVYKVRDPRAELLSAAAAALYRSGEAAQGGMALYQLATQVEQVALALLEEYKPGRHLQTNVEFYTALLLHGLGLDRDLFAPTFACGRLAGWIGHCLEQQRANRLIRPQSVYVGERGRRWQPLAAR